MSRTATLLSLRTQTLRYADMVNSTFVEEGEVNEFINQSYAELYSLLVQSGAEYKLSSTEISVSSGTATYALPADFWMIRGVDVDLGGDTPYTMQPFMFAERNAFPRSMSWAYGSPIRYRLYGDNIVFNPTPSGAHTVTVWYHAAPERMTLDADTIDGVAGWEEYVVLGAAIKCLAKEESDTSNLERRQAAKLREIMTLTTRDAGAPERVVDVGAMNPWWGPE